VTRGCRLAQRPDAGAAAGAERVRRRAAEVHAHRPGRAPGAPAGPAACWRRLQERGCVRTRRSLSMPAPAHALHAKVRMHALEDVRSRTFPGRVCMTRDAGVACQEPAPGVTGDRVMLHRPPLHALRRATGTSATRSTSTTRTPSSWTRTTATSGPTTARREPPLTRRCCPRCSAAAACIYRITWHTVRCRQPGTHAFKGACQGLMLFSCRRFAEVHKLSVAVCQASGMPCMTGIVCRLGAAALCV